MLLDVLLSGQLLFAALVLGFLYALIALGLNLVYGTLRLLNIAHGDVLMLGAYAAYWGFTLAGIAPLASAVIALGLGAVLGAAAYQGLFRRQLAQPALAERLEANSLLLFFGVSIIVQNLTALAFTASPRAYPRFTAVYHLGEVAMSAERLLTLVVAAAFCFAAVLFQRFHRDGMALKALIQNRAAAAVVGIPIERVQRLGFCAGFGLAGLAGALVSMTEPVSPFMGFPFTIAAFVVIILGGLGNLGGGILAGLLLGFVQIYGVALTSPNAGAILLYGVFVAILLLRPQGLFGGRRFT
ncbi:MAG: branched-chain amino acid ABC transporter permease [Gammaproteobacteria bacterium]